MIKAANKVTKHCYIFKVLFLPFYDMSLAASLDVEIYIYIYISENVILLPEIITFQREGNNLLIL